MSIHFNSQINKDFLAVDQTKIGHVMAEKIGWTAGTKITKVDSVMPLQLGPRPNVDLSAVIIMINQAR